MEVGEVGGGLEVDAAVVVGGHFSGRLGVL